MVASFVTIGGAAVRASAIIFAFQSSLPEKTEVAENVNIAKKVDVKSGFDLSNVTLFELHEGALVTITDERRGWVEVRLDPKQKGWVPKDIIGT